MGRKVASGSFSPQLDGKKVFQSWRNPSLGKGSGGNPPVGIGRVAINSKSAHHPRPQPGTAAGLFVLS